MLMHGWVGVRAGWVRAGAGRWASWWVGWPREADGREGVCLCAKVADFVVLVGVQVSWRPSDQEGQPRRVGPVRFRQHYCRTAGLFTGMRIPLLVGWLTHIVVHGICTGLAVFCYVQWTLF